MDNPTPPQNVFNFPGQNPLPNATPVLVLGIISIVGCFCYGIVGMICGIIALVLAKKDLALYHAAPGQYSPNSYNNLKAGRVCAIIGVSLCSLYIVVMFIFLAIFGSAVLSNPNIFQHMH